MMERDRRVMITGLSAAAVAAAGILSALLILSDRPRVRELWLRRSHDLQTLQALEARAHRLQEVLQGYEHFPATARPLEELARETVPHARLLIRNTEIRPSQPGWQIRKCTLEFTGLQGDELGRWITACNACRPPWALVECTLTSGPVTGQLAHAVLALETAERIPSP